MPVVDASVVIDWVAPGVSANSPSIKLFNSLAAGDAECGDLQVSALARSWGLIPAPATSHAWPSVALRQNPTMPMHERAVLEILDRLAGGRPLWNTSPSRPRRSTMIA